MPACFRGGCSTVLVFLFFFRQYLLMKVHSVAFSNSHLRASETISGINSLLIIPVIRKEQCRAGAMLMYLREALLTGVERVLSYVSPVPKNLHKSRVADGVGHRIFLIIFFPLCFFHAECWWLRDFSF